MESGLIEEIIKRYELSGEVSNISKIEIGHINDTYALTLKENRKQKRYILQRINRNVFRDVDGLIENIVYVTEHLRTKLKKCGGDISREALHILPTNEGKYYYTGIDGNDYRIYDYIEGSVCHIYVENTSQFENAAKKYAEFQKLLSDADINKIKDTIEDFHDTRKRFDRFVSVVKADSALRVKKCAELIDFVTARERYADIIVAKLKSGELPVRVTHNDTKINNILFDEKTDKGLCVIDLDTIMKGSMLYDFGDAIRYGCNSAKEDEKELTKVSFDKEKYYAYEAVYIKELENVMTESERKLLPVSPHIMTYELVLRFLTDYLEGDVYFKSHYSDHNYYRARCQARLLEVMEQWENVL